MKEQAFLSKGFSNWKDGTESFRRHEKSRCHKDAVQVMLVVPYGDVIEMLSTEHASNKKANRKILLKIFQNIQFLDRQGLPLRGHDVLESNFIQLYKLHSIDDPSLTAWQKRKGDNYLSPSIQNEILQIMSLNVVREITSNIHNASFFALMVDECTDCSNYKQLVLCLHWVDQNLQVHEDFIGLYNIPDIFEATFFSVINDCLIRMNLPWSRCRGQCYDGAANMAGHRTGVASSNSAVRKAGYSYSLLWAFP